MRLLDFDEKKRNLFIEKMAEKGVATNVHYKPLPMHTAYKNLGFDVTAYPNAYAQYANEVTLPLHTSLTDEDVDYVVQVDLPEDVRTYRHRAGRTARAGKEGTVISLVDAKEVERLKALAVRMKLDLKKIN